MPASKNINFGFVENNLFYINKDLAYLDGASSEDIDQAVLDIMDAKIIRLKELVTYVESSDAKDIIGDCLVKVRQLNGK